jgi:hypothetical protein
MGIGVSEHPVIASNVDRVFGDVVVTSVENRVTGKCDMRIDQADERVLITAEYAKAAFNEPTEQCYGVLASFAPLKLFLVLNGRNRQVKYRLVGMHGEYVWEAELVSDSHATCGA